MKTQWNILIQKKCQGGSKCALPTTVKFVRATRRFGRISFVRLFKFTVVYERYKKCKCDFAVPIQEGQLSATCESMYT